MTPLPFGHPAKVALWTAHLCRIESDAITETLGQDDDSGEAAYLDELAVEADDFAAGLLHGQARREFLGAL